MLALLGILLAAPVQETTPTQERISRLIKGLDAEDFDAREEATQELVELGKPALEPLEKVLKDRAGLEAKARARTIIGRIEGHIRRAKFKGGKVVAGLRAALQPLSKSEDFVAGKPIAFEIEIMNVDGAVRAFVPIRIFDIRTPSRGRSHSNSHARVVLKQISGSELPKKVGLSVSGIQTDTTAVDLNPGASRMYKVETAAELSDAVNTRILVHGRGPVCRIDDLTPGEYEIHLIYFAKTKKLLKGAKEDLKTNVVRFKVKEK